MRGWEILWRDRAVRSDAASLSDDGTGVSASYSADFLPEPNRAETLDDDADDAPPSDDGREETPAQSPRASDYSDDFAPAAGTPALLTVADLGDWSGAAADAAPEPPPPSSPRVERRPTRRRLRYPRERLRDVDDDQPAPPPFVRLREQRQRAPEDVHVVHVALDDSLPARRRRRGRGRRRRGREEAEMLDGYRPADDAVRADERVRHRGLERLPRRRLRGALAG